MSILRRRRTHELMRSERGRAPVTGFPRQALELARDIGFISDPADRIVAANAAAVAAYGYSMDELLRLNLADLRAPGAPTTPVGDTPVAGNAGNAVFETIHARKDGTTFPAEVSARTIDLDGAAHRATFVFDISERTRTAAALLESERLYRSLFENMLNGFAYCRMLFEEGRPHDFVYLAVNDAFESLTGLKGVVGRKASDVIPGIRESDAELLETYGRVSRTGTPERFETYVNALRMWFSISVYSPGDSTFVAVFDVITERKQAEAEIRRLNEELELRVADRTAELEVANHELESFSYSVSHDLRAPLRAIGGFAAILSRRYRDALDEKGRHYVDTIVDSSNQMSVLIDELLDYSRLGRRSVRAEPVPLGPLVTRLRATFDDRIAATGAQLTLVEPLATPIGDPMLIERILANLIDNALTYRRDDVAPGVTLSAARQGDAVLLAVADNGIGIAPEFLDRIFEVFARLHTDEEYPGTGIGLSIVRKAARLMASEITVESVDGAGSTFSLQLPAAGERSTGP